MSKEIKLNVNLFFSVPDDYVVTDEESVEFKGEVELHDSDGEVLATSVNDHETIESMDMSQFP